MSVADQAGIAIGALEIRYLLDGTVTGASLGMFELTVPPGAKLPPALTAGPDLSKMTAVMRRYGPTLMPSMGAPALAE